MKRAGFKAAFAALLLAGTGQIDTAFAAWVWKGLGEDEKWSTADNWNKAYNAIKTSGYYFRNSAISFTQTNLWIDSALALGGNHVCVDNGTSPLKTVRFYTTAQSHGITSTSGLKVGYDGVDAPDAHLHVESGTYSFATIRVGYNSARKGHLEIGNGESLQALFTATGDSYVYNGKIVVGGNARLISGGHLVVGQTSGLSGSIEIGDGGFVTNTAQYVTLGANGGSGEMTVRSGGAYGCVNATYAMIVGNGGAGTLNVQGGDVFLGGPLHMSRTAHASAVNVTDGGVLAFSRIEYGESAEGGAAALTIDGGTVRAGASNAAFIPGSSYLSVAVGENGATIDNAGYDITIARPVSGTGPLALTGSGTTTLDISSSAIPALSVASLSIPEGKTVALTFEGGAFPEGIYMICKTDGASAADGEKFSPSTGALAYTWSVDNGVLLLTVGEPAVNCTWTGLAGDGLFSTPGNWLLGKKPETGSAEPIVFGGASSSITNDIGELSPSSIVFQAGISALMLSGHAISGVHAISNLSYSASVTFLSPVSFAEGEPIEVYHTATYADTLTYSNADGMIFFKGGVTGYEVLQNTTSGRSNIYAGEYHRTSTASDFNATKGGAYRNIVYKNSSLTVDTAADIWELGVEEGGAFTSRVITVRQDGTYNRLSWRNDGEIVATEEMILTATGNDAGYLSFIADASKGNVFKAQKLVIAGSNWVRLSNKSSDVNTTTVFVGEDGIVFNDSGSRFSTGKIGNQSGKTTIRPWRGNFEIGELSGTAHSIAVNKATVFNTDNEAGEGRRITVNASLDNAYPVSIAGSGFVRYNRANGNTAALTVAGSATLELGAGAKTGTGAVTVNADATLSVPEAGTGSVGGASTLKAGCALSFYIGQDDCGVLSFAQTPTVSGIVTVKLAEDSSPGVGGKYTLTSGAGLTDAASFTLADGTPGTLSVENGELVYTAPKYFYITVR